MESLFPFFDAVPRTLFLDMNAFFCSVEQQECEQYRGCPTIVVPVLADTTCAIAASYEAKAHGIKTGTKVRLVRGTIPNLKIVEARPELYLKYHARLVNVLNRHFVNVKVLSVDEMACTIPLRLYKTPQDEERLACKVKADITNELGEYLCCSVGIAPNVFLSKVAAEKQKPDGLTIFHEGNLPDALFDVKLGDLPGIGPAMKRRLNAVGINTTEHLWEATPYDLRRIWKSVLGERWWYMLRGSHECDYQPMQTPDGEKRKSVGHSNVLAPEYRTTDRAKDILLELFAKALKRLRAYNLAASAVQITVKYRREAGVPLRALKFAAPEGVWTRRSRKHLHANDDSTWMKVIRPLLDAMPDLAPSAEPIFVNIVFSELLAVSDVNLSLFEDDPMDKMRLAKLIDDLNQKHDGRALQVAALLGKRGQVPNRIPFGAPDEQDSASEPDEGVHEEIENLPAWDE